MGHVFADITIRNPTEGAPPPMMVKALVDTGAATMCIPKHIMVQLGLRELEQRAVKTADGNETTVPYVGPLMVSFASRNSFCGALVLGDEVLMGAIPMEDMDLIVSPLRGTLTVSPDSPNIPTVRVKRVAEEIKKKVS
jgi:clan AA aspartic protease